MNGYIKCALSIQLNTILLLKSEVTFDTVCNMNKIESTMLNKSVRHNLMLYNSTYIKYKICINIATEILE